MWTPFFMLESKDPSDFPCNWHLAKDGVERWLCKAVGLPHHGRIMWVSTEKNNCVEEGFFRQKKGEGTHKSSEDSRRPPVTWFQSRLGSWKFEFFNPCLWYLTGFFPGFSGCEAASRCRQRRKHWRKWAGAELGAWWSLWSPARRGNLEISNK